MLYLHSQKFHKLPLWGGVVYHRNCHYSQSGSATGWLDIKKKKKNYEIQKGEEKEEKKGVEISGSLQYYRITMFPTFIFNLMSSDYLEFSIPGEYISNEKI